MQPFNLSCVLAMLAGPVRSSCMGFLDMGHLDRYESCTAQQLLTVCHALSTSNTSAGVKEQCRRLAITIQLSGASSQWVFCSGCPPRPAVPDALLWYVLSWAAGLGG
jgi:hypothetical protein